MKQGSDGGFSGAGLANDNSSGRRPGQGIRGNRRSWQIPHHPPKTLYLPELSRLPDLIAVENILPNAPATAGANFAFRGVELCVIRYSAE